MNPAPSAPSAGAGALNVSDEPFRDDARRLRISGTLDWNNFHVVDDALRRLFDAGQSRIVIDLAGTTFISSAGFGCFISGLDVALKLGGNLVFLNVPPAIREIFQILGLSRILRFAENEEEALRVLTSTP